VLVVTKTKWVVNLFSQKTIFSMFGGGDVNEVGGASGSNSLFPNQFLDLKCDPGCDCQPGGGENTCAVKQARFAPKAFDLDDLDNNYDFETGGSAAFLNTDNDFDPFANNTQSAGDQNVSAASSSSFLPAGALPGGMIITSAKQQSEQPVQSKTGSKSGPQSMYSGVNSKTVSYDSTGKSGVPISGLLDEIGGGAGGEAFEFGPPARMENVREGKSKNNDTGDTKIT